MNASAWEFGLGWDYDHDAPEDVHDDLVRVSREIRQGWMGAPEAAMTRAGILADQIGKSGTARRPIAVFLAEIGKMRIKRPMPPQGGRP